MTKQMILVEKADPAKRPIKRILQDAYAEYGTFEAAAESLDMTRQTFSVWWYRLGCDQPTVDEAPELQGEVA